MVICTHIMRQYVQANFLIGVIIKNKLYDRFITLGWLREDNHKLLISKY